ncbi:HPr family phosphocarrier protein [Lederbergia panacisoli]|uniref:HPr family phosphocarrier protein n=1 Tax=Lederbergia panacisoli TaxID=1255251 RepID=UPI00214BF73C|nr:HPr family phosphocarrier protein [Lederbergia panacisoli]MCR2822445.1 HPr family phosphocarrier protein [Lederbergia panacisoli]
MAQKKVEVKLNTGLQARSAALFVQEASRFTSDIFIEKDGRKVNAKSIMGLMSLAIGPGANIKLYAEGNDEEEVLDTLSAFVLSES